MAKRAKVWTGTEFVDLASSMVNPQSLVPTGVVNPFAGAVAPEGWLLCWGQELPVSGYTALSTLLGTTYGSLTNGSGGAGTTHFRLPDLRGRVIAALDNMGGTDAGRLNLANTLGTTTGSQTHTLITDEIPSHQHSFSRANAGTFTGIIGSNGHGGTVLETLFTANTGGGLPHNNMQPTILMNYIIKT